LYMHSPDFPAAIWVPDRGAVAKSTGPYRGGCSGAGGPRTA
jgi:hypothetical protein